MTGEDFDAYLRRFHSDRPGITEALLERARADDGANPYDWLVAAVPRGGAAPRGTVVDLACGSAPTCRSLSVDVYVGLDRSADELALARRAFPDHRFVLADAADPPLPDGRAAAVLSSFALQILSPLEDVLAAASRLLAPGGALVATLPAGGALTGRDRLRWARLALALRSTLAFPNDKQLRAPEGLLADAGLALVADEQRRFALPLRVPDDADLLVDSLYLDGASAAAIARAHDVARSWVGGEIGIAVRRLVATPTSGP